MKNFRVWIRPLQGVCRVRVDGGLNAQWLLTRLSQSFVFKSSEPMHRDESSSCSTFLVPYSFQTTPLTLRKLLAGIPQVTLMAEPA